MTPDDAPLPDDDQVARAARDGLRRLAGSHAPTRLDWDGVVSGARRARQRRLAAVIAACAIVLATAGAAYAGADHYRDRVSIAGQGETPATTTTTTTAPASTTTSSTTTVGAPGGRSPVVTEPTAVQPVQPGDLTGTIALATANLQVSEVQSTPVSLTVRNISDHPISILNFPIGAPKLEIAIDIPNKPGDIETGITEDVSSLGPGEQHTFLTAVIVDAPFADRTRAQSRRIIVRTGEWPNETYRTEDLVGVPPVPVAIVPPGWTVGQPLDPTQGAWKVEMTADATEVPEDGAIVVHATVHNVGELPQPTTGFGSLAIGCEPSFWSPHSLIDHTLDEMTLASGASATFSFEYGLRTFRGSVATTPRTST